MLGTVALLFTLATVVLPASPATAATTVTIETAVLSGTTLTVTGGSSYDDAPFVVHGTDGANDTTVPAALGHDLVAASTSTTLSGSLQLRFTVSQWTGAVNRPAADVIFARAFCATGPDGREDSCWEVDTFSSQLPSMVPDVEVWACADRSCNPDEQSLSDATGTAAIDVTGRTLTTSVPLASLGIPPGSSLNGVAPAGNGQVWTAFRPFYHAGGDPTEMDTAYEVPLRAVSVAIGASGQDPATVPYASASVAPTGNYSVALDVSGKARGTYTIYARACFGADNCGFATAPVTI